jgi:hypothetical protein
VISSLRDVGSLEGGWIGGSNRHMMEGTRKTIELSEGEGDNRVVLNERKEGYQFRELETFPSNNISFEGEMALKVWQRFTIRLKC